MINPHLVSNRIEPSRHMTLLDNPVPEWHQVRTAPSNRPFCA
jgi:hypothetical protein